MQGWESEWGGMASLKIWGVLFVFVGFLAVVVVFRYVFCSLEYQKWEICFYWGGKPASVRDTTRMAFKDS